MKINVTLRKELTNKNGLAPVSLVINDRGKRIIIPTGLSAIPATWLGGGMIRGDQQLTMKIYNKLNKAESVIARLELSGEIQHLTLSQIKSAIIGEFEGVAYRRKNNFIDYFQHFADTRPATRTREIYHATIKALSKYDNKIAAKGFEDITVRYLTDFHAYLSNGRATLNGAAIHLRNIRAVFNAAIDEDLTLFYPFRKFKIKHSQTRKKNLGVEKLRELWNCDVEPHQERFLDFWKLSFLLIGINTKDLCENCVLREGRVEYMRAKTHKPYSIKVEPEAMEIINKYRGKNRLLSFSENFANYKYFAMKVNHELKRLGGKRIVKRDAGHYQHKEVVEYDITYPELTMYHARHTWASLAAELDIPKETVAAALGHSARTVTDIYIDFDQRKVDAANRRVIDYVLCKK